MPSSRPSLASRSANSPANPRWCQERRSRNDQSRSDRREVRRHEKLRPRRSARPRPAQLRRAVQPSTRPRPMPRGAISRTTISRTYGASAARSGRNTDPATCTKPNSKRGDDRAANAAGPADHDDDEAIDDHRDVHARIDREIRPREHARHAGEAALRLVTRRLSLSALMPIMRATDGSWLTART